MLLGINPWVVVGVGVAVASGWARYGVEAIAHRDTKLAWEQEARDAEFARQAANDAIIKAAQEAAARVQAEKMAREAEGKVIIREVRTNATDCEDAVSQCIASGLARLYPENQNSTDNSRGSAPTSLLAPASAGNGTQD